MMFYKNPIRTAGENTISSFLLPPPHAGILAGVVSSFGYWGVGPHQTTWRNPGSLCVTGAGVELETPLATSMPAGK